MCMRCTMIVCWTGCVLLVRHMMTWWCWWLFCVCFGNNRIRLWWHVLPIAASSILMYVLARHCQIK
jgi:hypothetical protein